MYSTKTVVNNAVKTMQSKPCWIKDYDTTLENDSHDN